MDITAVGSSNDRMRALEGTRILDLTHMLSGPYATMLLADMGAEVIKLEPPGVGEATRALLRGYPEHSRDGMGAYFLTLGRNKKSVALDLKRPEARPILERLVAASDLVVYNFSAGVAERLGLDHARLAAVSPRIVTVSITGFGETGPSRDHASFDMVAQATGGGMSLTGAGDVPLRAGIPIGDLGGGMMATIGALAALQARHRTGRGQHVDISMQDVQVSLLNYMATMTLMSGKPPPAVGNGHFVHVPYNSFRAADGFLIVAVITDASWLALLGALELPELDTPDRRRQPGRLRDRDAIEAALTARLRTRPRADWLARLRAREVPCAPVHSVAEALADPQILARHMVVDVPLPGGGATRQPGNPIKLGETHEDRFTAPPRLGEHTDAVLTDLAGLGADELVRLRALRVIG